MGALNIPSAADVERLTRRLRSVSQRMEGIEEAVDRLDQRLAGAASRARGMDERLAASRASSPSSRRDLQPRHARSTPRRRRRRASRSA